MARNIFTKGTAITLAWHFTKPDGTSFDLSGYQLRLFYGVGSRYTEVSDFTLGTNDSNATEDFISWVFAADKQVTAGDYKMKLQIYQNGHLFTTMNYNNAFALFQGTPYSSNDEQQEEEAGVVHLYTAAEFYLFNPIEPAVGTDGFWYVNGVLVRDGNDNPVPSYMTVRYDETSRWLYIYEGNPDDPGVPVVEPVEVIKDVDDFLKMCELNEAERISAELGRENRAVKTTDIAYGAGSSPTDPSTVSVWSQNIPHLAPNECLWSRVTYTFGDDSTKVCYSVGLPAPADRLNYQVEWITDGEIITSDVTSYDVYQNFISGANVCAFLDAQYQFRAVEVTDLYKKVIFEGIVNGAVVRYQLDGQRVVKLDGDIKPVSVEQNTEGDTVIKVGSQQATIIRPQTIYGDVTNNPDNKTLNEVDGKIRVASRRPNLVTTPYTTGNKGYKILDNGSSFESQVTDEDTIYEIRYDYNLYGSTVTIPANCTLKFEGGSIRNGTVIGRDTVINNLDALDSYDGTFIKDGEFVKPNSAYTLPNKVRITTQEAFDEAIDSAIEGQDVVMYLDNKCYYLSKRDSSVTGDLTIIGDKESTIDCYDEQYVKQQAQSTEDNHYVVLHGGSLDVFDVFVNGMTNEIIEVSSTDILSTEERIVDINGEEPSAETTQFKIDISGYNFLKNKDFQSQCVFGYVDCLWAVNKFRAISSDSQWLTCEMLYDPYGYSRFLNNNITYKDYGDAGHINFRLFNLEPDKNKVYYDNSELYVPAGVDVIKCMHPEEPRLKLETDLFKMDNVCVQNCSRFVQGISEAEVQITDCNFRNMSSYVYGTELNNDPLRSIDITGNRFVCCGLFDQSHISVRMDADLRYVPDTVSTNHCRIENNYFELRDPICYKHYGFVIDMETNGIIKGNTIINPCNCATRSTRGNQDICFNKIYCTDSYASNTVQNFTSDRGLIYVWILFKNDEDCIDNTETANIYGNIIFNVGGGQIRNNLVRGIYIDDGRGDANIHENLVLGCPGYSITARNVEEYSDGTPKTTSSIRVKIEANVVDSAYHLDFDDSLSSALKPHGRKNILLCDNGYISAVDKSLTSDLRTNYYVTSVKRTSPYYITLGNGVSIEIMNAYPLLRNIINIDERMSPVTHISSSLVETPLHKYVVTNLSRGEKQACVSIRFTGGVDRANFLPSGCYSLTVYLDWGQTNQQGTTPTVVLTDLKASERVVAAKAIWSGTQLIVYVVRFNHNLAPSNFMRGISEASCNLGASCDVFFYAVESGDPDYNLQRFSGSIYDGTERVYMHTQMSAQASFDLATLQANSALYKIKLPPAVVPEGTSTRKQYKINRDYVIPLYSASSVGDPATAGAQGEMYLKTGTSLGNHRGPLWYLGTTSKWVGYDGLKETAKRYGALSDVPTTDDGIYKGFKFFATDLNFDIYWNGTKWVNSKGFTAAPVKGTTTTRTNDMGALTSSDIGYEYYDTTIGKPCYLYSVGTEGTSSTYVWHDAAGNTV